jgi:hypothetical protein
MIQNSASEQLRLIIWTMLSQVARRSAAPMRPVDVANGKFPFCLVWVPLPIVAWLVPFVGHVGICREDGVILDFAGNINIDNLAFGATAKYVRLDREQVLEPELTASSL